MSRSKHSAEWKIEIVKKYLSGEGSYERISQAYGIGAKTLKDWVHKYREQGPAGFWKGTGNRHYSKEFKIKCVEAVLQGEGSVDDIVARYNISARELLRRWIMKYNANMELVDYEPKREVYMAEARRKTTLDERMELWVYPKFCVNSNKWRKIGQNKIFRVVALTPPLGYSINRKLHACQGQRLPGHCSFYP